MKIGAASIVMLIEVIGGEGYIYVSQLVMNRILIEAATASCLRLSH